MHLFTYLPTGLLTWLRFKCIFVFFQERNHYKSPVDSAGMLLQDKARESMREGGWLQHPVNYPSRSVYVL